MTEKQSAKPETNSTKEKKSSLRIELTERQWQVVERYAGFGNSIRAAGEAIGVDKQTLFRRVQDLGFSSWDEYGDYHRESLVYMLASKLVKDALNGNTTAQIFALKNLGGWTDKEKPVEKTDERPPSTYIIKAKEPRQIVETQKVESKEAKDETLSEGDNRKE